MVGSLPELNRRSRSPSFVPLLLSIGVDATRETPDLKSRQFPDKNVLFHKWNEYQDVALDSCFVIFR